MIVGVAMVTKIGKEILRFFKNIVYTFKVYNMNHIYREMTWWGL